MKEAEILRDLFHRRWAMPTLAVLHRWNGAKFVTLHKKLGASAGSMRTTVDELIEQGLVMKNPGYGHPMRPEYVLTEAGSAIGEACDELLSTVDGLDARKIALTKWSLPAVHAISLDTRRFSEVRTGCPGITDRALAQTLKVLTSVRLVSREVEDTFPPTVTYRLTDSGRRLIGPIQALLQALVARGRKS